MDEMEGFTLNKAEFVQTYAVERKGTHSLKWDALDVRFGDPNLTAAWVADMEFKAPNEVLEAIKQRVDHGVFGYSYVWDSYYEAFFNWQQKRHQYEVKKEWMRFSTGIVTALYWFVNAFTKPGESVAILTPVYYPFHNAVKDNGRQLVTSALVEENGQYHINFEEFEQKIIDEQVKLFIHCSPHNPVGRVWTKEEQERLLAICEKHDVLVISDEIHQDLVFKGHKHLPSATIENGKYEDRIITVTAPSKTFNLAGLLVSHIIIPNETIREQFDTYVNTVNQTEVNVLGMTGAEAAYTYGEDWLNGLLEVVYDNYTYLKESLLAHAPNIVISPLEGTYLTWLDLRAYVKPEDIKSFIQDKCGVAIDYGEWFSQDTKGFIRINLGTHPKNIEHIVSQMIKHLPVSSAN